MSSANLPIHGYICHTCGQWHDGLPMDVGFDYPDYYVSIPESERPARTWILDHDLCIVDEDRFVRGCLQIPVIGTSDTFVFGIWSTLSLKSFNRVRSIWGSPLPPDEPPYFGWLSNRIAGYPDTINLKVMVRLRDGNLRPQMFLEPTDHPLAIERQEGISLERVQEIVERTIHST